MSQSNNRKIPSTASLTLGQRLWRRLSHDARYCSQYLDYIIYQHQNFDVKGLTTQGIYTLELEKVFVDLTLQPQQLHRVSTDPVRPMSKELGEGRHGIWEYLALEQLRERNLVIIGPPGSGKTTLLKHLALTLARGEKGSQKAASFRKLPIFLFLRDYADAIRANPGFPLLEAVQEKLVKWGVKIPLGWFGNYLKQGQYLIMLDGLDEVADAQVRREVVAWVERQMSLYRGNRFIITSRPFGYRSNPLKDVAVLEVRSFTMEQVHDFVHNWYMANEIKSAQRDDPGVRMEAQEGAEDLLRRLRQTHVLLDLSVNPLLLTMIATVHRYRSSLPGRRVELYAEICEVFLGKRQEARGMTFDLTPAQKQRVLQPLAYHMMCRQQREITTAEVVTVIEQPLNRVSPQSSGEMFLKMIENASGLMVERESGVYSFSHLTFQEYLASVHVSDQHLEHELIKHVEDSWWHETIRLYAAQADATNIIKACVTRRKPSVPALTLATECLEEAREVRPEMRTIFEKLEQSVEHPNPEVHRVAAEVLLTSRLRRMVRIDEDRYADHTFITHAEYQLFLDDARAKGEYHQPDHWLDSRFSAQLGRMPVTGVRPLDAVAFCRWLTKHNPGEWLYRLPKSNELSLDAVGNEVNHHSSLDVGYWFVSSKGFEYHAPAFLESQLVKKMLRHLEQRLAYDLVLLRLNHETPLLERICKLVLGRARQRAFALLDIDRDLHVDRMNPPDIGYDFISTRKRTTAGRIHDFNRALNIALVHMQSPNLMDARQFNLDDIVEEGRVIAQSIEHARHVDSAPELARTIIRYLNYARERANSQDAVLNPGLIRALNEALRAGQQLASKLDGARSDARARICSNTLLRITAFLSRLDNQTRGGQVLVRENQAQIAAYVDLYLDCAILEERIKGKLPAFEGIRIIKELKQPVA